MSDPAVEAAQRAWARVPEFTAETDPFAAMEAAAREALAPIRELHTRGTDAGYEDEPYCETCGHYDGLSADFIHQPWPCATARLVYTTDEVGSE